MKKLCVPKVTKVVFNKKNIEVGCTVFRYRPLGIKRIRMTCPLCGRRLMSSVLTDETTSMIFHSIPPHKPKEWWKRKNKE